jgi:hypothetical protein
VARPLLLIPILLLAGCSQAPPALETPPDGRDSASDEDLRCPQVPTDVLESAPRHNRTYEGKIIRPYYVGAAITGTASSLREGDRYIPVDCSTYAIAGHVEWDHALPEHWIARLPCLTNQPLDQGQSPLDFTLNRSYIAIPIQCWLSMTSPPISPVATAYASLEFRWRATVTNLTLPAQYLGTPADGHEIVL